MYSLGANSFSWNIIGAKFYTGSLNILKILLNSLAITVQKAGFLAQDVPELQIAGGWEEVLGKLQTFCVLRFVCFWALLSKSQQLYPISEHLQLFFSPRYKQRGYLLHRAFLFLYQKSTIKNMYCFPSPPTPQISFDLQLTFSFFHHLAELLFHYFF